MDEYELEQLRRQPQWIAVLEVYHRQHAVERDRSASFDGWVPRIHDIPDVGSAELPGIHGKLIAFGFLKFDLAGRDGGMRYQLTPLGKQAITTRADEAPDDTSADSAEDNELISIR